MLYSPDGKYLVIPDLTGSAPLRIIGARDGKVAAVIKGGESAVFVGKRLAVTGGKTVGIWELGK